MYRKIQGGDEMKFNQLGLRVVLLLMVILSLSTMSFANDSNVGPVVGKIAPDFQLADLNGKMVSLKDVVAKNKVTIINFWATWCPPCKAEIPDFIKFYANIPAEVALYGIDLQEKASQVKSFAKKQGMKFPILIDTKGTVAKSLYQVMYIPMTFIIDQQGKIREIVQGGIKLEILESKVQALLKEK